MLQDLGRSDYFPTICEFGDCGFVEDIPIFQKKCNFKRADWTTYKFEELFTDHPPSSFQDFQCIIEEAADGSIPIIKPRGTRKGTPIWWDDECRSLIQRRKNF